MSAASNVRWVGVGQIARVCFQFLSILAYSRLLDPSDYGVMAMAAVIINFGTLFRDMGLSTALIQNPKLTGVVLDTVFWLNIAFGVLVGVGVAISAPAAGWFFDSVRLTPVLMMLALVFPVMAGGAVQLAFLERNGEFRKVAAVEISSGLLGLSSGVLAAYNGYGVYSFAIQAIVNAVVSSIQFICFSKWRPTFAFSRDELKSLLSFSGNLVFFNLINYFARNVDSALVGKVLGADSLGLYSIANRMLLFPLQNVTAVTNRALLPVYSREQANLERVVRLYFQTLSLISVVTAPLMFGLWALREPFVVVFLGAKWLPVSEIVAWIAPMGYFQSLTSTTGIILLAIGRADVLRTLGVANTSIVLLAFWLGLQHGLIGMVAAYFFATGLVTVISLQVTLDLIGSNIFLLLRRLFFPAFFAFVMAFVVRFANIELGDALPSTIRVGLLVLVGAALYVVLLAIFMRDFLNEIRHSVFR
ncbi:MAG: oligosaccharide flippase family protein [Rhodopseudomonas sp.]|nr:oligosaccharide flippase family protein [Rhodopseudomonas sp.]